MKKMVKIIVLGGAGVVGRVTVKTLTTFSEVSEVIIGDIDIKKAHEIAEEINSDKVLVCEVDITDPKTVQNTIRDIDIVINCVGPFYKFGPLILKSAIETGRNYVDINDDVDATQEALKMDNDAKKMNITALIGMGSSPGITNLLAKFAADQLLDEVHSIDLYHAHGGEPFEGPGVIYHRIHSMSIDIPVFLEGKFVSVGFFDTNGRALEEEIDFLKLGKYRVHPYPHPETITLPKYIKDVKRVTNKGTVIPSEYFYLITNLVKLGLTDEEPLTVRGNIISPLDFTISYIIKQRERILKEQNFGSQRGCIKIVVKGKKDEKTHTYIFSLASENQAMGEATGIPAAIGAVLLNRKKITKKGVLPPEACVNPLDFLNVMQEHLGLETASGKDSPLTIESIDEDGNSEIITL
ncbi:MAG: saccharopine dehydrogenase NADP-binding domain-containing protein [Candidatus Heimdallarchaeota archaeon]|nr:MAG: saccharopine dehydrogenase NADP-binding domain-containing protein [Candidatus Heimdallarchaeota archaeon]